MIFSGTVSAGQAAYATQYNNLRKDVAGGGVNFNTSSGANSAYAVTIPQITTLSVGQKIVVKANHTSTGACT
jgi:hypothetical protein